MPQKEKNISYPHDKFPELGLLRMAARGLDPNLTPTEKDFQWIVKNLKYKRPVILFKWFWRHEDVDLFSKKFIKDVKPENLEWYLQNLSKILLKRRNLHWIERVNLFHIYGLSRLFNKNLGIKLIDDFPFFKKKGRNIISLSDLSAYNVSLMLRDASAKDSIKLIDSIKNRSLLSDYGMYQLYYYEGISNLLDILKSYLTSSKQVIIPQTIAGLFEAEAKSIILTKRIKERIYDELLHSFSRDIIIKIEKKDIKR